uniref:Protein SPA1-RELATED 2 n=1 Tax=Anthurium amnicola TaxID=1678845 RepID=A0A1D1Z4D2_9ARAE
MEGTSEVNDTLENSAENPHLQRKEHEQAPRPEDCNAMELPALSVSQETGWPVHLFSMKFPEIISETLEDKKLLRCTSSQSGSEHLGTNLCSTSDANAMVEELTLTNYKNARMALAGCSNSGDKTVRNSMWQNLYKLVGDPMHMVSKAPITNGCDDTGNVLLNQHRPQQLLPHRQTKQNFSMVSECFSEGGSITSSDNMCTDFLGGIRTKVLPAHGLPEFLVKSSLKRKGIAYRHPSTCDAPGVEVRSHNNGVARGDAGKLSDKSHNFTPKIEDSALYAGGGGFVLDSLSGINLREWLNSGRHKIDKSQRLGIFKQILEFVDNSHSQGAALQDLRPWFFLLTSPNHVKYVGSFISQVHVDVPMVAMDQGVSYSTNRLKRKSHLEVGKEAHEVLLAKQQKVSGQVRSGSQCSPFGEKFGWKVEAGRAADSGNFIVQNSGFNFREQFIAVDGREVVNTIDIPSISLNNFQQPVRDIVQLEEMWYTSPEELNSNVCPFSSNVYSLGVLFFELLCYFESWKVHAAAMVDLHHRILPPNFLSECPKEAAFCLWLLHPEPSSRPKSRDILLCEFMCEAQDLKFVDHALTSIEEEDAEAELLLHFLLCVKEQKEKRGEKLAADLRCLRADIGEVERRNSSRIELPHIISSSAIICGNPDRYLDSESVHPERISRLSMSETSEARLMRNMGQLEHAYFSIRSDVELPSADAVARTDTDVLRSCDRWPPTQNIANECCTSKERDRVGAFFDGLCKYARYSKFEVRGTIRNGDLVNSANVICSLSFDRDEDYLAAAGVSKKIKIFELGSLLNENVDIHYPAVEMLSKSKLSCVCWNSYIKNYLASTDYDGVVQLWDASTGQGFTRYADHQRRAWSVDFSQVDPTKLASGSDDCSVKLWSLKEKNCINTIRNVANICCVQFSSHSTHLLAVGSADYKVYCYDLRNTRIPWCTLTGHGKAVSYVKFVDSETLVSASTDNSLKLWDLHKTNANGLSTTACSLTLTGHTNEKNFVGLSVSDGYIACGSETNEVYAYYKSLPMPITSQKFGSMDPITGLEIGDDNGQFVSSVCWREKSNMVVAANSSGCIKLLQMV